MLTSSFQSSIDSKLSPEMKTKIRKFHLWKKKHVGVVVGVALLLLLAVGAGASMILVRISSDLRQQAMVESGGGSDPYAPISTPIRSGGSICGSFGTVCDSKVAQSECYVKDSSTGLNWKGLCQLQSNSSCSCNYDQANDYDFSSCEINKTYCINGSENICVKNQWDGQNDLEFVKSCSNGCDVKTGKCASFSPSPTPGQGGGNVCGSVGNQCDAKSFGSPCTAVNSNGSKIPGVCFDPWDPNATDANNGCSCYSTGLDPSKISCIGGESYCYGGSQYVCNANNVGITKVKSCGILGCDESTGKCKVVPTATPMQITCYWRYPSTAQYCSKTMRTVSYPTQTCEQIGSYLYTNEGDCNGKYAVNPTPTPTIRVPTSTPILFVTNTPVPTSAPIVFVTNTPAPTSVPLPTSTPTIVIQEPVQSIPVCRTTSGMLSRFSWWRNICAK